LCGMDALVYALGMGTIGLASRVQRTDRNWASFTVRASTRAGRWTEYDKRLYALERGRERWLMPGLTLQAYGDPDPDDERLLGAALIWTADLIEYIRDGTEEQDYSSNVNGHDGNGFQVVYWCCLADAGRPFWRVGRPMDGHDSGLCARRQWE